MPLPARARAAAAALAASALAACGGTSYVVTMEKPSWLGAITTTAYDGTGDDLLTAGLGKSGLAGAAPPIADPLAPTAAELRRLAIYNNYRALVDVAANGGYGTLYGPNLDADGRVTAGEGKVAGTEYLAYADDGSGAQNVTLMVQLPATFDRARPCIVTATSSGSRGVYGAIGTAGEWGLKRGCAVAYADKGTGMGVHDLATDTVNLQAGARAGAAAAGKASNFTAPGFASWGASFNASWPHRLAFKHAHSKQNPERDWGRDTLRAVEFAFYVLNLRYANKTADGTPLREIWTDNTIVIASSVSNGAGAAIAAAEQDTNDFIDGVAVSEPNLALPANPSLLVRRGSTELAGAGRPLYDYFTLANLLQPCAALAPAASGSPGATFVPATPAANRCASLRAKGVLTASGTIAQATEALDLLLAAGWQPESTLLHASHYAFATPAIATTYASTYGRFGVEDRLCDQSFAAVDANGRPAPLAPASLASVFATGNGIPPTAGVQIVNDASTGGPIRDALSTSPSTGLADLNVDGALCQRALWTGSGGNAGRVQAGVNETLRSANLRGKPAIIVHGRADALIPVSFSSRPYYAQNRAVEGAASRLVYVEVTNAQHFDAFIDNPALPGYDSRFVPLHVYFNRAMDRMWQHLAERVPLPASQVVRTVPRGGEPGKAPAITAANVPPIVNVPTAANAITFAGATLVIPD